MPFQIFAGENLLIQVPIYVLQPGWTWRGVYDATATYVVDDALLGLDNIGYHVIAAPPVGTAPPDVTYYEVLDAVPAESVKWVVVELTQPDSSGVAQTAITWTYRWIGDGFIGADLTVGAKYLIESYVAGDDFTNVGAGSNTQGVVFQAVTPTPAVWTNGSVLRNVDYPVNFKLETGQFIAELLNTDSQPLSGQYDMKISIGSVDSIYIASGAQTDVLCIPTALEVMTC